MFMKPVFPVFALLALGAAVTTQHTLATPVPEQSIPDNVDWFVHLDADQLRASRAGSMLIDGLLELDPLKENENLPINPLLVINGLRGITAFGTMPDFNNMNGDVDVVTVISGTPELIQIFQGMLSGFQLEKPEAIESDIRGSFSILSLKEAGVCGTFLNGSQVALSKSRASLDRFIDVCEGKVDHLRFGDRFPLPLRDAGLGVYFGVYVEGLSTFENMPAQARILQLTQAVAVQLGESDESLHLLASLVTDQPQTAQQVSQVLQGIIAMLVLTQNGQPDVAALIQSTRVSQQENAVTLRVDYPVVAAEKWIHLMVDRIRKEMEASGADAVGETAEGTETQPTEEG